MTTPKRVLSFVKPHSQLDRINEGLNLHAPKRNSDFDGNVDASIDANPAELLQFKHIQNLVKSAPLDHPEKFLYLDHYFAHHLDEVSIGSIAAEMGVPKATAQSRLDRTGELLRGYIDEHE